MATQKRGFLGILLALLFASITFVYAHASSISIPVTFGVGDTVLHITGKTSPNSLVTILDEGAIIGTTTSDATGAFVKDFNAFPGGIHHIGVYAQPPSGGTTDTITVEISVAEHFQTNLDVFLPPTLHVVDPSVTIGQPFQLHGVTIPSGVVIVTLDDTTTIQVTADSSGNWTLEIPSYGLATGPHSIYAVTHDTTVSQQSYPTNRISLHVAGLPTTPSLPPASFPTLITPRPAPPTIISPKNDTIIEGNQVAVCGSSQPFMRIDVFANNQPAGSVFSGSNGAWCLDVTLSEIQTELKARACTRTNCSEFSNTVIVRTASKDIHPRLVIKLDQFWYVIAKGEQAKPHLTIQGGVPPYTVTLAWGDGQQEQFVTDQPEHDLKHIFQHMGQLNARITVTDKVNQIARLSYTVDVLSPSPVAVLPFIFYLLIICLLLLMMYLFNRLRRMSKHK